MMTLVLHWWAFNLHIKQTISYKYSEPNKPIETHPYDKPTISFSKSTDREMKYFKNIFYFSKFIIWLVLFFTFLFVFGKPAYMDYNRFKVMVDESKEDSQPLMTPAMTICVEPVS